MNPQGVDKAGDELLEGEPPECDACGEHHRDEAECPAVAECDECGRSDPHQHPWEPGDEWYPLRDGSRG